MVSEEKITGWLNDLLTRSGPGDSMHHLIVVAAPAAAFGPLGVADEERLEMYAIAPVGAEVSADRFVLGQVMRVDRVHRGRGEVVLFAALGQEMWHVDTRDPEAARLAARLSREGRLFEHPDMVEETVVYGACRDRRRWRSRRTLTGPEAGTIRDVELLVGPPHPGEGFGLPVARMVRHLVGMT